MDDLTKKYYTISEVADMIKSNTSLLRFWEREFPTFIKPKKNNKGVRIYTVKDIQTIRVIHHLVKDRGYTLEGAKKKMKSHAKETIENAELVMELQRLRALLVDIRDEFPM
jgi:DNA-binding transcriptional MerR regulator